MKVLVVEDEKPAANYLKSGLSEEGFAVDVARTVGDADDFIEIAVYDVVLLDVMLPGGSGIELCRNWRKRGISVPILFLTARDDLHDRVAGLDAGSDDYLIKPFSFEELTARIRALLRRQRSSGASDIAIGSHVLDMNRRRLLLNAEAVSLTAREYQLLEYLALNCGRLVTRTALWEHVWETGSEPDSNVVDVYIRYVRNKLGDDGGRIETVRGRGYVLNCAANVHEHQ